MIFLGYDPCRQGTWALIEEKGVRVYIANRNHRAREVINGLCAVGERLPDKQRLVAQGFEYHDDGAIDLVIQIREPWQVAVEYSDQAYQDLLEIADAVHQVRSQE
jgi:hypothetical protein